MHNANIFYLNFFRFTTFKPLQSSLTAQTFISTHPVGKTIFLIMSSVTSVTIPELLLYHDTQIAVEGPSSFINELKCISNESLVFANTCTSSASLPLFTTW